MTDNGPELNKTEMRQGNSRKMNTRALIFGLIGIVILFALVYWFSTATYDDTATTTGAGTTLEDTNAGEEVGDDMTELPTPTPEEPEAAPPVENTAPVEAPAETPAEAPAETEAPVAP